jgi:acyl-coenzyme A synthetase/AMP-(fatty) acid ligase
MCVRGPTATVYWSPREIQTEAVRDGWTVVQDLIWMDDQGFIHFVARHDEVIVSGGLNISPVEVERVLVRHPAVRECACVASPDDAGERAAVVKAFIALADGHAPEDDLKAEIQDFFKRNGPPFMYPRKIEFVDALPKSLTGKVQRSVLRRREFAERANKDIHTQDIHRGDA